ncbi:MAG: hypothetical protein JSV91_08505 [Phycisphaerales bacterium]|nr:MAG: hypothetical protein JSV91_08505 [Phycisphaerales bacterium]
MAVGLDKIPRFTIERLTEIEGRVRAAGHPDRRIRLGLRWWFDLYASDDLLVGGRIVEFRKGLQRIIRGPYAVFETEDLSARELPREGQEYPIFDGYWGERAELVLDPSPAWERRGFVPLDAIARSDGAELILKPAGPRGATKRRFFLEEPPIQAEQQDDEPVARGAWDHEHCAICWETISEVEGAQHEGYANKHGDWVCIACFELYVKPKNLAFPIDE